MTTKDFVFDEENTKALKEHFEEMGENYFPDEVDIMVLHDSPARDVYVSEENLKACADALWDA